MTVKKQRLVVKGFKTLQEWKELGFELKANETCFAINLTKGAVYADCQVKKIRKQNKY